MSQKYPLASILVCLFVLGGLRSSPVAAQGVIFDIGVEESIYSRCAQDGVSWELFPSFTFGPNYPVGSIVWALLELVDCDQDVPVDGVCISTFIASFDDGGCGCGGLVLELTSLELHYDPAAVAAAGVEESSLRLVGYTFDGLGVEPAGVVLDTEANAFRLPGASYILGSRWYSIVGDASTAVEQSTWSNVKSLWR